MSFNRNPIFVLSQRLTILLIIYTVCRILFYLFNHTYFDESSFSGILIAFLHGTRFDITAILITNIVFICMHLFAFSLFRNQAYQLTLKILFYTINIPAILFNCIDLVYFKFINKRTTADFFNMLTLSDDVGTILPQLVKDFWFIPLLLALLVILIEILYRKTQAISYKKPTVNRYRQALYSIAIIGLCIIGARGGLQLKPIGIINAAEYGNAQDASLVLNTPFCLLKTFNVKSVEKKEYFTENELSEIYNPIHSYSKQEQPLKKHNVVILILESFSKEYIGSLNEKKGYTPFIDSIIGQSLVFTNAYANGKKSIEGIPAITAGIPTLMNEPYVTSVYAGNQIASLASLLKEESYQTAFFHGGTNGTMGFDSFIKMAGFDHYYGRTEYNNERDYDGNWGVYDEHFLNFFADHLDHIKQPFFTCFFSLSSHHPFTVPEKYGNLFLKGTLPIHESIMYTDYALRKFFKRISKAPWFKNTLFVITADHTGPSEYFFYKGRVGMYAVPILFYTPDGSLKGKSNLIAQQIDIFPSILDYMHYNKPFFAFGQSVFDSTKNHVAINFLNNIYQLISDEYILQFDGNKSIGIYDYKADSLLSNNLLDKNKIIQRKLEKKLKAVIQTYNKHMINNTLINIKNNVKKE